MTHEDGRKRNGWVKIQIHGIELVTTIQEKIMKAKLFIVYVYKD
jgi:hypothetical protein